MKIISNLSGDISDVDFAIGGAVPVQGVTINIYPLKDQEPGFIRHAQITNSGVIIRKQGAVVMFPLEQLIALAEKADPSIIPPKRKT